MQKARERCPGLPGFWINGWLAAVGTTVLNPRIRLGWTEEGAPRALLSCPPRLDPVEALAAAWPDAEQIAGLPIAEQWQHTPPLQRKVSLETFAQRARAARGHPQAWALSSTLTDLCVDENGQVAHAPFDPAGPGSVKWLHHRLKKVHALGDPDRIADSLAGRGNRVKNHGLGFDLTRLGSLSDSTSAWVDPVIEVLAFFGLALLPVRGAGTDRRRAFPAPAREIQKGWVAENRWERRFTWPAWRQPLDSTGIDALLDAWMTVRNDKNQWPTMGVHAAWQTVQFKPRGTADITRAFGAERV